MAADQAEQSVARGVARRDVSVSIGARLREARSRFKLTLKEVEARSRALAERWGNPNYSISASWLYRVEMENRELSATKLIVLAVIYSLPPEQLLEFSPGIGELPTQFEQPSKPNVTTLLDQGTLHQHALLWLPDSIITDESPDKTEIISSEPGTLPAHYIRGIVGREDRTLDPMVRSGSLLLIDTSKTTIADRRKWSHEFDRPIYFMLTHDGYVTGFCELDKNFEWLTVVPHPLSYEMSRRWRYKKEIEVIGTVAAVMGRR